MIKRIYLIILVTCLFFFILIKEPLAQKNNSFFHSTLKGQIELHSNFYSKHLSNNRNIIVYLPPNYDKNVDQHYPVFYLHDGQNIFDSATSFIGKEWECDETAQKLILAGDIQAVIIIGIYNTGIERVNEYTPSVDGKGRGGKATLYGKFIVEELKPFIDQKYRTLKGKNNTALGGSSLGGLVSLFLGLEYPEVFGKLAVISPSVWWDNKIILKDVEKISKKPDIKIWLDIGTKEGKESVFDTELLKKALVNKGWKIDQDLKYLIAKDAKHNEQDWALRFEQVLKFLFPVK